MPPSAGRRRRRPLVGTHGAPPPAGAREKVGRATPPPPAALGRLRRRSAASGRRLPSAYYYFQAHKAPLDGFSISEEGGGARRDSCRDLLPFFFSACGSPRESSRTDVGGPPRGLGAARFTAVGGGRARFRTGRCGVVYARARQRASGAERSRAKRSREGRRTWARRGEYTRASAKRAARTARCARRCRVTFRRHSTPDVRFACAPPENER